MPVPQAANQKRKPKPEKVEISKNVDVRKELIADVSRADLVPKTVSAKASDIPPVRKGVVTMVGMRKLECHRSSSARRRHGTNYLSADRVEIKDEPPPPAPSEADSARAHFRRCAEW